MIGGCGVGWSWVWSREGRGEGVSWAEDAFRMTSVRERTLRVREGVINGDYCVEVARSLRLEKRVIALAST